jgi:uncharacterized membrane-anchored protein YjiN (DUF445 family)
MTTLMGRWIRLPGLGGLSLGILALGLAVIEFLYSFDLIGGPIWIVVKSGFEAGMVGGVADWFAVTALFRQIHVPLIGRHTNIILKNRKRLADGIAQKVQNEWLAPETVSAKLRLFSISKWLLEATKDNTARTRIIRVSQLLIRESIRGLDSDELATLLERLAKEQLIELDVSGHLGDWIATAIDNGYQDKLLVVILDALEKTTSKAKNRRILQERLVEVLDEYKNKDLAKNITIWVGRKTGGIDEHKIATILIDHLLHFVRDAKVDADHPLRLKFNETLIHVSNNLRSNEAKTIAAVREFQKNLIEESNLRELISTLLGRLKVSIRRQLGSDETELGEMLGRSLDSAKQRFERSEKAQARLDAWVRDLVDRVLKEHGQKIGEIVNENLNRLSDKEFVQRIESQVGKDLQFIRLNGAVVGACVGAWIAGIRILIPAM